MRRSRTTFAAAAALLLLTGVGASCAPGVPTGVVAVPGNQTFYASQDLLGNYVRPTGTVAFCIDRNASLVASGSNIGIAIGFGGVDYVSPGSLDNTVVTPKIGPGCGTLSASAVNTLEGTLQSVTVRIAYAE